MEGTCKVRPDEKEPAMQTSGGNSILGSRKSKYKAPEQGVILAHPRSSEKAGVARNSCATMRWLEMVREVGTMIGRRLGGMLNILW